MNNTIVVDGVTYTEETIRKLKEAYEYNRETLLMFKEALKGVGKTTDPNAIFEGSAEGVAIHE